jgi:hypothetical protein
MVVLVVVARHRPIVNFVAIATNLHEHLQSPRVVVEEKVL